MGCCGIASQSLDENSHIIFGGRGKGRGDMGKSHTPSTHLLHGMYFLPPANSCWFIRLCNRFCRPPCWHGHEIEVGCQGLVLILPSPAAYFTSGTVRAHVLSLHACPPQLPTHFASASLALPALHLPLHPPFSITHHPYTSHLLHSNLSVT